MREIKQVGIIGAGTMGAGIAAHLANADIPVVLLDIVTPGLEDNDPTARNRHVQSKVDRMKASKPPALGSTDRADLITVGNIEDDFDKLAACDWVIEVIIEKLEPKQQLMARLESACKPDAIISTNTSGIPIAEIAANCSPEFKKRFLGTHFFNPPRYMKLLEIIPTQDTAPEIVAFMRAFGRDVLGKGDVLCKDTPNFIANRIGTMTSAYTAQQALQMGYTVAEVDALLGELLGRPKTAFFRLGDLIGVDLRNGVMNNLHANIPDDPYRETLNDDAVKSLYERMIENNWLGNKSGQGFYKKIITDTGAREFWTLNLETFDYELPPTPTFTSVEAVKKIKPTGKRIAALLQHDDRGADFARRVIFNLLEYTAFIAPQAAYSLADIDNAVRWGFNHELGPFELWDELGVAETVEQMEAHGFNVAQWVKDMLAAGNPTFYSDNTVYDFVSQTYTARSTDDKHITIAHLRQSNSVMAHNDSASLHDMGDDVLLLEFHSKVNALDFDIFDMGYTALERMKTDFDALVIGNEGRHFSVGANLGKAASGNESEWEAAAARIRAGQKFMMALHHAPKPVVTAVHGRALGGGAEVAMQGWHTIAHHDAMIGLVEFNVGLVPAWTGCKILLQRRINPIAKQSPDKVLAELKTMLKQLMGAQVSSSAWEAKHMGYLRERDTIIMNADHRLHTAKQQALSLVGTPPPEEAPIYAAGQQALTQLQEDLEVRHAEGVISAYDKEIGLQLACILCGGDAAQAKWVSPWHILDLEREASLILRQNTETKDRIAHMLTTGKPLRN